MSQNGWPSYRGSNSNLTNFPWVTGKVRGGDVYTVLDYLAKRFNVEVEKINKGSSWGYRGIEPNYPEWGNHTSGTAVDFNAPRHSGGGTFNAKQQAAIRRILNDLGGVIRWGGDYQRAAKDDMHFEINVTPGSGKVQALAKRIRDGKLPKPGGGTPAPAPAPKPTPTPAKGPTGTTDELARAVIAGKYGTGDARKKALGSRYAEVQARVNQLLAAPKGKTVDQLAREVIAGKHGNGDARKRSLGSQYAAVQARVNQLLRGK